MWSIEGAEITREDLGSGGSARRPRIDLRRPERNREVFNVHFDHPRVASWFLVPIA